MGFSQQTNMQYPESYDPTDYNDHSSYGHPTYHQPQAPATYQQPTYAENATVDQNSFDHGYAQREGIAPAAAQAPRSRVSYFGFMSSTWAALFMATTAVQAVICLCFEA